jgi:hypothetical protein
VERVAASAAASTGEAASAKAAAAARRAAALEAVLAKLVVDGALVRVGKNLVGFRDLWPLVLCWDNRSKVLSPP